MSSRPARGPRFTLAVLAALAPLLVTSAHERSAHARLRAVTVPAGKVALRTARAGQGATLVLLHGYGESLLAWREVFPLLSGDFDVVAMDLPGFGLSTKPATGYAVDSFALAVVRAMDALGVRRAVLVGHSLGGTVAAAVAASHPDRVAGLVLVDPATLAPPWPLPPATADSDRAARRVIARYYEFRARLSDVHDPDWLAESDSALAYDPAGDPAYPGALQAVLREFDFAYLDAARARQLRLPVLVLWGEYDPVVPLRAGRELAAALPSARLEVVARSWHRPHEERPVQVAALIAAFAAHIALLEARSAH